MLFIFRKDWKIENWSSFLWRTTYSHWLYNRALVGGSRTQCGYHSLLMMFVPLSLIYIYTVYIFFYNLHIYIYILIFCSIYIQDIASFKQAWPHCPKLFSPRIFCIGGTFWMCGMKNSPQWNYQINTYGRDFALERTVVLPQKSHILNLKITSFEKENHLPNLHFGVPAVSFRGVYVILESKCPPLRCWAKTRAQGDTLISHVENLTLHLYSNALYIGLIWCIFTGICIYYIGFVCWYCILWDP